MMFDESQFKIDFQMGCVFAYPTEAVFGVGCDPLNQAAMEKVLTIKHRPQEKGVILIAGDIEQLNGFVNFAALPESTIQRIHDTWPGPFTWLVPKGPKVKEWISGGSELVAVRVTDHALVINMCNAVSSPLVSTSANIGGMPPAKSANEVIDYFGRQVKLLDGELGSQSSPSTIINALTMERIR